MQYKIQNTNSSGFSLIEVLVATFIFVIVLFSAMIIFSNSLKTTSRAEQFSKAQESMYYPIELISREIRQAKSFQIKNLTECPNGIIITSEDDSGTEQKSCYFLNGEAIAVKEYQGSNWSSAQNLSSEGARFSQLTFQGSTASENPDSQPFVQIQAKLKTDSGERKTEAVEMDLQTTVSLRNIDWKFQTNN